MGQATYGILYGEEIPEDRQDFIADLIGEWEEKNYATCEHRGSEDKIPFLECENANQRCYIGFFVAIGASGIRGLPRLENCLLSGAQEKYSAAVESAKQRWNKFTDWAVGRGALSLHCSGQLWLIETEVA